jgi:hypothetical protein
MISAGQQPVKTDWMKLQPTNTVRSSHQELTKWARATLSRARVPARRRM